jgi:hypothetical protein
MTPDKYRELKAITRPVTRHAFLLPDMERIVVAIGKGNHLLYAAHEDRNDDLVEWMPDHPFVRQHVDACKPDYILGPV